MEQQNMTSQLTAVYSTWTNPDFAGGPSWSSDNASWALSQQVYSNYVCPSVDPAAHEAPWKRRYFRIRKAGATSIGISSSRIRPGLPGLNTYIGSAGTGFTGVDVWGSTGAWGDYREGVFTSQRRKVFTQILDGTSNTLAVGEYMGWQRNNREWFATGSWIGAMIMWSARVPWDGIGNPSWAEFSSPHPQTTMFCLGDASTRPVRNSVDVNAFRNLCGIRDGASVDVRAY